MSRKLNLKAVIVSGLAAGIVFMMLEMALVATVGGQSPWGPPRMIAAMAMGKDVLPPPATFNLSIMMVAMMIHFITSIILAAILGGIISYRRMGLKTALVTGVGFGLLVYIVNFYLMTGAFPWFAMARGGIAIFSHVMFGLVLGWIYHAMADPAAQTREEALQDK